jgi:hypothetical protein
MFQVLHRDARTLSDKLAYGLVRFARFGFDLVSRYKHVTIPPNDKMTVEELRKAGHLLDHQAWLNVSRKRVTGDTKLICVSASSFSKLLPEFREWSQLLFVTFQVFGSW